MEFCGTIDVVLYQLLYNHSKYGFSQLKQYNVYCAYVSILVFVV
jgi:hypothetical protein